MEEAKRTKIHPRRTWAIAARWFQLSRNFQFRVAFERTSKFREREREKESHSVYESLGESFSTPRFRKLDERKDGRFRGITFNQEVTYA